MRSVKQHIWVQVVLGFLLLQYISCDCLLPKNDFPHGTVIQPDLVEIDNKTFVQEAFVLRFTCSDGYLQIGQEYLQCVDGNWSSTPPFCADKKCPDPPVVTNATYVIESGVNVDPAIGSFAVYSCEAGFELVNKSVSSLKCTVNMESRKSAWEGEVPVCQEKTTCPDPGHSKQGSYSGDCCFSGNTIRFSCKDGYELVGNTEMHCLKNGIWSSSRPLCKPLSPYCEMPPKIAYGVVTGKKAGDYFQPEEEAQVLCEQGYKCVGKTFVLCENEGRWRDEFGVCEKIFCERPPNLTNGAILDLKNLTSFPYDYELTYICDEGYRIYGGDSWRTCDKNGWSGRTPRCEPTRCPNPGIPENGMKIGSNYKMGSRVRFTCFTDYELLGSSERICKSNGEWTGETARCNIESNYCPNPGTPIGGFKNMTKYRKGDRVRFRCQPGNFMLGSGVRECLENRTWSGKPTKCVGKYDFDNNAEVRNMLLEKLLEKKQQQKRELDRFHAEVQKQLGNGFYPGRILDVNYPGRIILYFAIDVSGSIKRGNFQQSIDFAKAIVKKVNITKDGARAGAVTFGSRAELMFMPLDYYSNEAVLDALDRIKYTGGGTAASSALNLIRKELVPLMNIALVDMDIKSVIFLLTDGKANMGGDPKKEAQQLKDEGVEIFCVGITGDVRLKTLYDIASSSLYGEETRPNVFILQDYRMLAWVVQELTKGSIDYSQCGLGTEKIGANIAKIVGGNVSVEPWPWMAVLYMSSGNSRLLKCGGSIIHRHFILTAAHCMYHDMGDNYLLREAEEISVKLGLTKRHDFSNLQEFEVRKIHVHPNNKNSRNNLDYDIALLELKRPITFNEFVRPICLPPPELAANTPFYKPGLPVWVIGFGYTKEEAKGKVVFGNSLSQELKEISLPIVPRVTCTKSLKGEIGVPVFTDRMFCAGTGEGERDTCRGDSGGPVMQSDLNGEGYLSWTQVGVISWGLGCGVKYEYSFYTHLHRLMPWVRNTIEIAMKWMQEGT